MIDYMGCKNTNEFSSRCGKNPVDLYCHFLESLLLHFWVGIAKEMHSVGLIQPKWLQYPIKCADS
jgi:hypothetical protein